ncbi:hypothetical protein HK102_003057, partial [Quaeritorhiza haematococci]
KKRKRAPSIQQTQPQTQQQTQPQQQTQQQTQPQTQPQTPQQADAIENPFSDKFALRDTLERKLNTDRSKQTRILRRSKKFNGSSRKQARETKTISLQQQQQQQQQQPQPKSPGQRQQQQQQPQSKSRGQQQQQQPQLKSPGQQQPKSPGQQQPKSPGQQQPPPQQPQGAKGELFISENMIGDDSKYLVLSKTSRKYPFTALEKPFECRNDYINDYVMNNGKLHMVLFDQAVYKSFFWQFSIYEELHTLLLETRGRDLYVMSNGKDTHLTAWRAVLAYYKEEIPLPKNDDDVEVCDLLFALHLDTHVNNNDSDDEDE